MPLHIRRGLALVGFGLLLGFFGLIWVANLFGVAHEHAKRTAANPTIRWMTGGRLTEENAKDDFGIKLGRYLAGGGFMVSGLLIVVTGIIYLVAPPNE
jgi:hypothetical protein